MAKAEQHGDIKVKCNFCGKEKMMKATEYYRKGGVKGGCCVKAVVVGDVDTFVSNTYSTVSPNTKIKTNKASRDRKGRGSMKG